MYGVDSTGESALHAKKQQEMIPKKITVMKYLRIDSNKSFIGLG